MKKPKAEPRCADHVHYGRGMILEVRQLDGGVGVFVADLKFPDGSRRTIALDSRYWKSGMPMPPKLAKKPARAASVPEPKLEEPEGELA